MLVDCDSCGQEIEVEPVRTASGAEVLYVCPLCGHEHRIPAVVFFGNNE